MPTYVVTGASSGIGLELVKQLAARGDKVFATCRKRQGSMTGSDQLSEITGDVTIIEDIDLAKDDVGSKLAASPLAGIQIDVVVHNAGSINGTREVKGTDLFAEQKLDTISTDCMLAAFQLNTLGPLRAQQALNAQMTSPGGKVCIISTGMGSIGDNGSGGLYAYRCSKAAINMLAKGMSCDLKEKGIAVVAVNPNMVVTDFGPGSEMLSQMGAMSVSSSCNGLIKVFDNLNMDNTGRFMTVPKDGSEPCEFAAGW